MSRDHETNRNDQIMVLTGFCPWKGHLLELEEEMGIAGELKYVLYAEGDPAGKWRIQVSYLRVGLASGGPALL